MKKFILLILAMAVLLGACEKEDTHGELKRRFYELIDEVEFSCSGISSEWYMSAKLNGNPICYNHGENNYKVYNGVTNGYITPGPVLNPQDTSTFNPSGTWMRFEMAQFPTKHLGHSLSIFSPKQAFGTPLASIAEQYLKTGDIVFGDSDNYFSISLDIYCCPTNNTLPTYTIFPITSSWGFQAPDNYLRIIGVSKRETPGYIYYDVTFEFQCDLYHKKGNGFDGGEYFGKLEEGILVTQLAIPREG